MVNSLKDTAYSANSVYEGVKQANLSDSCIEMETFLLGATMTDEYKKHVDK